MAETASAGWDETLQGWGSAVVSGWVNQEFAPDPAQNYHQLPAGGGLVNANTQAPAGSAAAGISTNTVLMIAAAVAVAVIVAVIVRR